jgi:toxin-antitoxin system PIN domain toxin
MIIPDANVLIYAVDDQSALHKSARAWIEAHLSETETIGFAWVALLAFLRVSTRPRVFAHPLTVDQALEVMDRWLDEPAAQLIHPTDRHPALLREMLQRVGSGGNLVPDAHLAALAVEYDAVLATGDRDFQRFPRVRILDPYTGS